MRAMSLPRARLLVVEDEPQLRSLLRLYLERERYDVREAADGVAALEAFEADQPDLVILDLMLPRLQGEAVLESIRERSSVPILITSARRSDVDRIAGLRMGADDYLGKPFNPHELVARVAAILRRSGPREEPAPSLISLAGGRLLFDPLSRRYTLAHGEPGRLTPGEGRLLTALVRRPGSVLSRAQLLDAVARRPDEVFERTVDAHVANLRRKLGDDPGAPWLIETIPETGYRLVAALDPPPAR
jgi:DNA-binding response OmpR family regulator